MNYYKDEESLILHSGPNCDLDYQKDKVGNLSCFRKLIS